MKQLDEKEMLMKEIKKKAMKVRLNLLSFY